MSLVYFSWVDYDGKANDLLIDASPARTHTASAQVTEHPVEKGSPATDHIRPMPRRVTIEGIITNTPLGAPPTAATNDVGGGAGYTAGKYLVEMNPQSTLASFIRGPRPPYQLVAWVQSGKFDRVTDSFLALAAAVTKGYLFSIATSLSNYDNMAATDFKVTEDKHSVNALNFSIDFQELRIVETKVVMVPARKTKQKLAEKTPSTATDDQTGKIKQSTADAGFFGSGNLQSGTPLNP